MLSKIEANTISENVFDMIGKRWMLITAGEPDHFNTMTASWGGLGVIWSKNAATIYVRKHRYTFEFLEKSDYFTLSFFGPEYRKALQICGSESGRDCNKVEKAGLTPIVLPENAVTFDEAENVLLCKKLYRHEIGPEFMLDPDIDKIYPQKDYHVMFIGEIITAYRKDKS